ncbi:MAG: hypothetical protein GX682_05425 [Clostridiaceae bacterium]|nr:hypothetical protein [Clostridiaceae bacterium]
MKIIGIDDIEKKKKQLNQKKLIWTIIISTIIIIGIVVFCIYLGNRPFREFIDKYIFMKNITENNVTSIALDDSENNYIYSYDRYISVLNQNTLVGYNTSGNKEYELSVEIINPIVDINNRFLLIAEKEKQKIYLISGKNIVWEKDLDGNISRISVNKNGYVSVIISGTTYKSIIQTFDNTGKEMFKTYLSYSIAMDSDISNDNKNLSFVEISTNGTLVQSIIKTISIQKAQDTPSESTLYSITSPSDCIPLNLKYQDGNRLICMYDNCVYCIKDGNAEEIFKLKEDGKKITYGSTELSASAFRVIEKNILLSTESTIEILNTGSKNINMYTLDGTIKEVYCYDNVIALNLGTEVHFIGTNGWLIKKYTSSQEIKNITINSNFAAVVYKDKIEIINL